MWEYWAKSELHPASAGLEVRKGGRAGLLLNQTPNETRINHLPPFSSFVPWSQNQGGQAGRLRNVYVSQG